MLTKPRLGTRLNLAHSLAKGLDLAIVPEWDRDPLYGAALARTGAPRIGGGSWGNGLATTAGSQYVTGYWPKRKYDARTVMLVADFGSWALYGAAYTSGSSESLTYNGGSPYFQWQVHGAAWNTAHTLIGNVNWSQSLQSRRGAVVVLTWNRLDDGYARAYVNGILAVTGASSITTASDRTQTSGQASILVGAAKSQSLGASVHSGMFNWARAMSQSEAEDLSGNPWQIFSARRLVSMYVPGVTVYSQALSVSAGTTAAWTRQVGMSRASSASGGVSAVRSVSLARSVAAVGAATAARLVALSRSAAAGGAAVCATLAAYQRLLAGAASSAVILEKIQIIARILSAAASGIATLEQARQWVRSLAASASGVASASRAIELVRSAASVGTAEAMRAIALVRGVSTSGTAALVRQISMVRAAVASGVAVLVAGALGVISRGKRYAALVLGASPFGRIQFERTSKAATTAAPAPRARVKED